MTKIKCAKHEQVKCHCRFFVWMAHIFFASLTESAPLGWLDIQQIFIITLPGSQSSHFVIKTWKKYQVLKLKTAWMETVS